MTRKDYVLIASVIKANADRCYEHPSAEIIAELAGDLATALQADNQSFDRLRFVTACLSTTQSEVTV